MVPGGLTPTCTGPLCHVDRVSGSWLVPPLHTRLHPAGVTPGSSEFGPETLLQKWIRASRQVGQKDQRKMEQERRDAKRRETILQRDARGPTHCPSVENQEHQTQDEETQRRHHNRETLQTPTQTHSDGGRGVGTHSNHRETENKQHEKHCFLTIVIIRMHRLLL